MNVNKKYVIIGIIMLIAAWTGNIIYYQKHMLKEPVFTKHYYDITEGRQSFQLKYIDNINSQRRIVGIVFPEIGPEFITFDEWDHNTDNRYYKLKSIDVRLSQNNEIPDKYKLKLITKADVHMSDGKVITVDIGKIFINNNSSINDLLQLHSSMGSSDNTGESVFYASKDSKIQGISSQFPEFIEDMLEIKINDKPIKEVSFPIELKKGDSLNIYHKFQFSEDSLKQNYSYDFPLYIIAEDSEGRRGDNIVFIQYWLQFPELYDIDALKMDRGIN